MVNLADRRNSVETYYSFQPLSPLLCQNLEDIPAMRNEHLKNNSPYTVMGEAEVVVSHLSFTQGGSTEKAFNGKTAATIDRNNAA